MDERVKRFGRELRRFRMETREVARSLEDVANEFHKAFLDVKKATIAGSTAGVVGGTLAAVGFGLSFFTFGASLILTAVGAGIGAAGGITAGGAAIGESVQRKKAVEKAEELIKRYERTRNDIIKECKEISDRLSLDRLEANFPLWISFVSKLVGGTINMGCSAALKTLNTVYSSIQLGRTATECVLDSCGTTGRVTAASLRATSAAAQGLHLAGGVLGIVLIPLDLGFLVHSAHAVATDKLPDTSRAIKEMADKLINNCPDESDIDRMIDETVKRLRYY